MTPYDRPRLLAEQRFLNERIDAIPVSAKLTRASLESRMRVIQDELAQLPPAMRLPATARLTFGGRPVIGSQGVFADFGTKAMGRFADAIAAVAASITAPLAAMGPIPGRDQNQLLITGTARGSFGFELEEYPSEASMLDEATPVQGALERTQRLLAASIDPDDEVLADAAAELDPRALDKLRDFVAVLADNEAVCGLQVGEHGFRFADPGQVRRSMARLSADNLHEREVLLDGEFLGALPTRRSFEFRPTGSAIVLNGKIGPGVADPAQINAHLNRPVKASLLQTQVGTGRPRYTLISAPNWAADVSAGKPAVG